MDNGRPDDAPRLEEQDDEDRREKPVLKPPAVRVPESKKTLQRRREWFERRSGSKQ